MRFFRGYTTRARDKRGEEQDTTVMALRREENGIGVTTKARYNAAT